MGELGWGLLVYFRSMAWLGCWYSLAVSFPVVCLTRLGEVGGGCADGLFSFRCSPGEGALGTACIMAVRTIYRV
jgi:hypothetical protein